MHEQMRGKGFLSAHLFILSAGNRLCAIIQLLSAGRKMVAVTGKLGEDVKMFFRL